MDKQIAVLAGDGIGPEVMNSALRVLKAIEKKYAHNFIIKEALIGGAAYDEFENHLPNETLEICKQSDAILFGSVGGPINEQQNKKWQNCEVNALLGIRKEFGFNANFRPAKVYPELSSICPLKEEVIADGVDLLIIRELVGGIYFGKHCYHEENGVRAASDTATYTESQIESVVRIAFDAASKRSKKLTSVDKANVLHTSKLWREVVERVSKDFSDVNYEHMLVDNCAMQIITNPSNFDVIVTENMFGDILSDASAVLPGSLGLTPSASFNKEGFAMYEPSGGSAPDIAGKGIANPIAQILSTAMMLQFSFGLINEATEISTAVEESIKDGIRTSDIQDKNKEASSTEEFTNSVIDKIK